MDEEKQKALCKELMNLSILYNVEPTEDLFVYMQKEATRVLTDYDSEVQRALFQLYQILINDTRKRLRGIEE